MKDNNPAIIQKGDFVQTTGLSQWPDRIGYVLKKNKHYFQVAIMPNKDEAGMHITLSIKEKNLAVAINDRDIAHE